MKKELNNWQTMDSNHFLHPFTDHHDLSKKGTRVITKGDGIYIWDSEGNKILDGMSGLWCVSLGYGNDELIQAAYDQMKELPYYNSFFQCAHPPAIELSQKISDIAPDSLNHIFFTVCIPVLGFNHMIVRISYFLLHFYHQLVE